MADGSALIVGVGPGLGSALARRFAAEGHAVAVASRDQDRIQARAKEIGARGYSCDVTDEQAVSGLVERVEKDLGPLGVVVFNASRRHRGGILDLTADQYRNCWEVSALGGFLVGQAAARCMLPRAKGTILFTGATASRRGGNGFAAFAGGKFALRSLSQSMARELGPLGIHVAHVVIDGRIGVNEDASHLSPDDIADVYHALHRQPKSAWSQEVDLRPWVEKF